MLKLKIAGIGIIVAMLGLPGIASAESWICEHSNLVREITVQRDSASPAPCSVVYDKNTEGLGSSALWNAQNDGAYCDAKANGLAEKLSGLGWACTRI